MSATSRLRPMARPALALRRASPALGELLPEFSAPEGWTVLRTETSLKARWKGGEGEWAVLTVRWSALRPEPAAVIELVQVGDRRLLLAFCCGGVTPHTRRAAEGLICAVQAALVLGEV
jgi:hypothetical protein